MDIKGCLRALAAMLLKASCSEGGTKTAAAIHEHAAVVLAGVMALM